MTSDQNHGGAEPEDVFADLLVRASEHPSPEVLTAFYKQLLTISWIVPERAQEHQMTNQPAYPNDFLNILGVQNKDQVFVPIFSSDPRVREWSGHEIRGRVMTIKELIALLPEGWWIILNPGSEGEKDLSPWEIELLKGGEANIPALIEEMLVEDVIEDIEMHDLAGNEFQSIKEKLIALANKNSDINQLFLVRERGKTISEKEISSIILGVLLDSGPTARREEIQEAFAQLGAVELIGAEKMKVRVGDSIDGNLLLGIFQGRTPIYTRERKSWISRFLSK